MASELVRFPEVITPEDKHAHELALRDVKAVTISSSEEIDVKQALNRTQATAAAMKADSVYFDYASDGTALKFSFRAYKTSPFK